MDPLTHTLVGANLASTRLGGKTRLAAAALVIGAWWGRARALILVGLLLLPVAWTASLVDVPLEGGWGSRDFAPATAAELHDAYRLAGGELVLDLTGYDGSDASVDVSASVGFGDLRVLLPEESGAVIDAGVDCQLLHRLGAGEDHPMAMTHPEGEYLKGLCLRRL